MATPPNQKTPEANHVEPQDHHAAKERSSGTLPKGSLSTGRYEPRDLGELMRYCKIVIQSDLCPRHIKSPADAMLIIQRGAELGLSAVNALQNLNVISGKVTMPAALAVGVVKASDACEYFTCIESTDEYSTWETKRRGNPEATRYTFSKHDAQVAGLWGSGTWRKYPRNLLAARASMNLARMEYQDVLVGVYTPEELEAPDQTPPSPTPAPAQKPPNKQPPNKQPPNKQPPNKQPPNKQRAPVPEAKESPVELQEESVPEPSEERPVHWSEEPVENPRDKSRTKKWQKQNERFHALMRTADVEEHCEAFREMIKQRHEVSSWTYLPSEFIGKWCDLLAKKSDEVDEGGDNGEGEMSERARWVQQKLTKHAETVEASDATDESDESSDEEDDA